MKLAWKILMVLAMTLAILVPLTMIRGVIHDRQAYRTQAVERVARSYAGAQGIAGPVLVVPYVESVEVEKKDDRGTTRTVLRERDGQWTFFPEVLDVAGRVAPSTRRVGLHEVRVYELAAQMAATFAVRIPADPDPQRPRRIGRPWLSVGIGDVRGLAGVPRLRVDGVEVPLRQGLGSRDGSGLHARLVAPRAGRRLALDARLDFALGGTESLALAPLGARNRVVLDSPWRHPQFNGAFLPRDPTLDENGFHAEWAVSSLASNAQAQYLAGATLPWPESSRSPSASAGEGGLDAIGVSLVDPVNPYSQADRASKYGLLFVLLTFVGFFMFELIKQLRIHPIQYGLVGLALAIFFLLLVSLSEHVAFGLAYLAASVACIGLLGYYLAHVLRSRVRGLGFAAMLALLYAALYGLLVSEDNALALGAGLLFCILAAIMAITRRVDWYQVASAGSATQRT